MVVRYSDGQLGDGNTTSRQSPVQVMHAFGTEFENVVDFSGSNHSLFLKNDGTVWATGNGYGQLGMEPIITEVVGSGKRSKWLKFENELKYPQVQATHFFKERWLSGLQDSIFLGS